MYTNITIKDVNYKYEQLIDMLNHYNKDDKIYYAKSWRGHICKKEHGCGGEDEVIYLNTKTKETTYNSICTALDTFLLGVALA